METKPYSLQSPEQIAKDYGGNKQRIAEAMQMGIIDPTAGTMAGMFIDRMRMAQQQEMAPQQTVAQQVFAPPAPPMGAAPIPAGLGATPEAAAMAAAAPQMMAPPPPPMGAPGMAAGGLTTLPLPDAMFDEPDVGGYASGGLVAFSNGGGAVDPNAPAATTPTEEEEDPNNPDIRVQGRAKTFVPDLDFSDPTELGGYFADLSGNVDLFNQFSPYRTQAAQEFTDYLRSQLAPEARRERQQQDMWSMLGQLGARMASTPGSLLQALGAGIGEAVPATAAAARERRAEERQLRESILGEERTGNREQMERFAVAREMLGNFNSLNEARKNRAFESLYRTLDRGLQRELGLEEIAAGIRTTGMQVGSQNLATSLRLLSEREARRQEQELAAHRTFAELTAPGTNAGTAYRSMTEAEQKNYRDTFMRNFGANTLGGAPPPPPGAVRPRS